MAKQRALLENWGNLETSNQMCERTKKKNKAKDFSKLLGSHVSSWLRFHAHFKIYQEEVFIKSARSDDKFNALDKNDKG